MPQKSYSTHHAAEGSFNEMCKAIFHEFPTEKAILKITFFAAARNNNEYISNLDVIIANAHLYFGNKTPLITYVAQKPFIGGLNAEVMYIEGYGDVTISYHPDYLVIVGEDVRELITGGIFSPDITLSISEKSDWVFLKLQEILKNENFSVDCIYRQWNYIESITTIDSKCQQPYQAFNDSRSKFYANYEWSLGYPASTGIGTSAGGVVVEVMASSGRPIISRKVDNALQMSPYRYTDQTLVGSRNADSASLTTPKFERAWLIGDMNLQTVYISGTAAIRGESSLLGYDVLGQAKMTIENINYLISSNNLCCIPKSIDVILIRVYLKDLNEIEIVASIIEAAYRKAKIIYSMADICRTNLLIEIEGIAVVNI